MITGLYMSTAGASVQQAKTEVISNNLANLQSPGFKRDLMHAKQRLTEAVEMNVPRSKRDPLYDSNTGGLLLSKTTTLHDEGPIMHTGNRYDIALQGDGFLKVLGPDNEIMYTRAGNLDLDSGGFLTTAGGKFRVLDERNAPINLSQATSFNVDLDGTIRDRDQNAVAKLGVVAFDDTRYLKKAGHNLYRRFDGAGEKEFDGLIKQQFLEQANVNMVQEMVNLIGALRAYQSNMSSLQNQDQTLGMAVSTVGRVQ